MKFKPYTADFFRQYTSHIACIWNINTFPFSETEVHNAFARSVTRNQLHHYSPHTLADVFLYNSKSSLGFTFYTCHIRQKIFYTTDLRPCRGSGVLVTCLPSRRPGVDPKSVPVRFVVGTMTMVKMFLPLLPFSRFGINLPMLRTCLHSSLILHDLKNWHHC
jgi:hypothetical protein